MKIIGICGSPREGNTKQLLDWTLQSCSAAGAETEIIMLCQLKIGPCNGCNACYGSGRPCVIHDEMENIISELLEADAILLGSPNYFTNISGILKNFIDRTNPLCEPRLLKDKIGAAVCVGARPKEETAQVADIIKNYLKIMQLKVAGSVVAQAEDAGEVAKQKDIELACTELGNRIIELRNQNSA